MNDYLKKIVESYKISPEAITLVRSTRIVLLVGISGAGKDTIKHKLLETGSYHHIVSHATRPKRENAGVMEQDGVEYHFINNEQAMQMLENHEYVEAKFIHGTVYGTSVSEIAKAKADDKIAINDVDVQGLTEYKAISPEVIAIFILPPNYQEWQRRLRARYAPLPVDEADLTKRKHTAMTELEEALDKPYYHFVVNDGLDEAVEAVDSIARHHNEFTRIDKSFQVWAERLLSDLRSDK